MQEKLEILQKANDNIDVNKSVIALVDCDSFFVSCEQKVNPELKGKAVCVLSGHGECVISRSREAKALGIPMGIPTFKMTKDMKEKSILITASHGLYGEISEEVMNVLKSFSPKLKNIPLMKLSLNCRGWNVFIRKIILRLQK